MEPSPFSQRMLQICLEHAVNPSARPHDRALAARLAATLLAASRASERESSDVASAILGSIGLPRITSPLIRALCRSASHCHDIGPVLERIAHAAFRAGDSDTLCVAESLMSTRPEWTSRVRSEWQRSLIDSMVTGLPANAARLARLVRRIVHAGEVPSWLRERVETYPSQFCTLDLGLGCMAALHRAAPTVQMWRHLASASRWGAEPLSWDPRGFGTALPAAIETLQQAVGQSSRDSGSVVLARWLVDLVAD